MLIESRKKQLFAVFTMMDNLLQEKVLLKIHYGILDFSHPKIMQKICCKVFFIGKLRIALIK